LLGLGTTQEWIRVLEWAAIFGAISFSEAVARRDRNPSAQLWHFAGLILTSLMFGMMVVFGWRVLRSAIVALFAAGILGLLGVGLAERRASRQSAVASKKL
jgi:hypothetical protein